MSARQTQPLLIKSKCRAIKRMYWLDNHTHTRTLPHTHTHTPQTTHTHTCCLGSVHLCLLGQPVDLRAFVTHNT